MKQHYENLQSVYDAKKWLVFNFVLRNDNATMSNATMSVMEPYTYTSFNF